MPAPVAPGPTDRRPLEFAPAPLSRLWIGVCLGIGAAVLAACAVLGLGEVLCAFEHRVLEAVVQPRSS